MYKTHFLSMNVKKCFKVCNSKTYDANWCASNIVCPIRKDYEKRKFLKKRTNLFFFSIKTKQLSSENLNLVKFY